MDNTPFLSLLLERVLSATHDVQTDLGEHEWSMAAQWDSGVLTRARDVALRTAARAGFSRRRFDPALAADRLASMVAGHEPFARTYALLADEASRDLYLDVLCWRVLGSWHVKLPVTPRQFSEAWKRAEAGRVGTDTFPAPGGIDLPLLAVDGLQMWAHPIQVVALFDLCQYDYRGGDASVRVEEGDVVLDGGAGFGDSALAFAARAGNTGRVVSCEMDPGNLEVLQANLAANPDLAPRVKVVPRALWRDSQSTVDYTPAGGLSAIDGAFTGGPNASVRTQAIDDLELERLDFLKLDVEGAEIPTLEGARATLARHRPKLAVAVYHSTEELGSIACLIDDMGLGYRFYLGHYTPGAPETILFGVCA